MALLLLLLLLQRFRSILISIFVCNCSFQDDVNVEDHLLLFGRLRGLHGAELRESVKQMADSLGFPDKVKSMAGTLSGGQKRRLCVGLR